MSPLSWFAVLGIVFISDVYPNAAAQRIDSCHRPARSSSRISEQKCEEYTRGTACDHYNYSDIIVKADGVETAKLGEFPHLALIASNAPNRPFICTGTLISRRHVLTAAHCISHDLQQQPGYVVLGDHNINPSVDDGATPVTIPVKMIIKHPDYKPPKVYNDIGLLELAFEVNFTSSIRPACLWTEKHILEHYKAVVSTIDYTRDAKLRQSEIQKVTVTIKDDEECNKLLPKNRGWAQGMATTQLCGQESTGTNPWCRSLGGSPLQIAVEDSSSCKFQVLGITSFGSRQCNSLPTVFTRVSSYVDWIENVVWPQE